MSARTTNTMKKINLRCPIIGVCSLLIRCNHADGPVQLSKVSMKRKIIKDVINTDNVVGSGYSKVNRTTVLKTSNYRFTNLSRISPMFHVLMAGARLPLTFCPTFNNCTYVYVSHAYNSSGQLLHF